MQRVCGRYNHQTTHTVPSTWSQLDVPSCLLDDGLKSSKQRCLLRRTFHPIAGLLAAAHWYRITFDGATFCPLRGRAGCPRCLLRASDRSGVEENSPVPEEYCEHKKAMGSPKKHASRITPIAPQTPYSIVGLPSGEFTLRVQQMSLVVSTFALDES